MSRLNCLLSLWLGIIIFACADNPTDSVTLPPVPQDLGDGWEVSSLASEGINPERVAWLSGAIKAGQFGQIHSVLIARNNKLVFEEYYGEYNAGKVHALASVTKSIVSLLVGIAKDRGYIENIDEPIEPFFPEYAEVFAADTLKRSITIRNLLTMSSGLQWDEWSYPYNSSLNSHYQMERSLNWVSYTLRLPLTTTPGTSFTYNSGNSILLGGIIKSTCETQADLWAEQVLFTPLGISTYQWYPHNNGMPHTGGGLHLRPRDLAKIGYVVLNEGKWGDRQIVSEDWLRQSAEVAMNVWPDVNYGFQWWLRPLPDMLESNPAQNDIMHGWGYAGQFLFVIQKLNMVVVCNSWNLGGQENAPVYFLYDFILRAVSEGTTLAKER